MTQGICELIWLQKLMRELKLLKDKKLPLFCDNKAVINITQIYFNMTRQNTLRLINIL